MVSGCFILPALLVVVSAHAPVRGSVRAQVRKAKTELQVHATLREYRACPYQPEHIVERIHELESDGAWAGLCTELTQIPDEDLELFEDAIRAPEHARKMKCAPALLQRIDAYWKSAARELDEAHPMAGAAQPAEIDDLKLETVTLPIDVHRDAVFTDAMLPEGQVAITLDDGPHPTRTPRILAILAQAHVKATFFEIGKNAAAYPEITRQVADAGHIIGSHTFSHPDLPTLTMDRARIEIESGHAAVSTALGVLPAQVRFFRFPYGAKTPAQQAFVESQGLTTFFWNMDSQDWKLRNPHKLFLNVLAQLDHGRRGIILFHDIQEQTVIVLPHLLNELRARHIKTVVFVPKG